MSNQDIKQYLLKVQVFATSRIDERSGVSQKTGKFRWPISCNGKNPITERSNSVRSG